MPWVTILLVAIGLFFLRDASSAPHTLDRVHTPLETIFERSVRFEIHYLTNQPYYRTFVRYGQLQKSRVWREYIQTLPYVKTPLVRSAPKSAQKAFWINTYNALVIEAVVQHYPLAITTAISDYPTDSLRGNPKAWRTPLYVAGKTYSFEQILAILEAFEDPRVILAISTAAFSSPALPRQPYTSNQIEFQLEDAVQNFCLDPVNVRLDRTANTLFVSDLFRRYSTLFQRLPGRVPESYETTAPDLRAVLGFVWPYLPPDAQNYISARKPRIRYMPFDWELNDLQ